MSIYSSCSSEEPRFRLFIHYFSIAYVITINDVETMHIDMQQLIWLTSTPFFLFKNVYKLSHALRSAVTEEDKCGNVELQPDFLSS